MTLLKFTMKLVPHEVPSMRHCPGSILVVIMWYYILHTTGLKRNKKPQTPNFKLNSNLKPQLNPQTQLIKFNLNLKFKTQLKLRPKPKLKLKYT